MDHGDPAGGQLVGDLGDRVRQRGVSSGQRGEVGGDAQRVEQRLGGDELSGERHEAGVQPGQSAPDLAGNRGVDRSVHQRRLPHRVGGRVEPLQHDRVAFVVGPEQPAHRRRFDLAGASRPRRLPVGALDRGEPVAGDLQLWQGALDAHRSVVDVDPPHVGGHPAGERLGGADLTEPAAGDRARHPVGRLSRAQQWPRRSPVRRRSPARAASGPRCRWRRPPRRRGPSGRPSGLPPTSRRTARRSRCGTSTRS